MLASFVSSSFCVPCLFVSLFDAPSLFLCVRCVEGTGQGERDRPMNSDKVVSMLEANKNRELFLGHDQLSIEIKRLEVFYEYEEPELAPDLYPTYKKFEDREVANYCDPGWVKKTYHTNYREPIYKVVS